MPNIARDETVAGQVKKAGLPRLADVEVQRVAEEIRMRWPNVTRIGIAQRIGPLEPGMQVLMVACTSDEYDEGLWEAAQLGMNRLGPGLCLGQRANASEGSGIEHSMPDVEDGERT
ncbi:MAG: molybdenum cofactor biosynthesis protein MoaE [Anaerolineales bacterium]